MGDSSSLDDVVFRAAQLWDVRSIAEFQTRCWAEAYRGLVPQSYLDRMGAGEREIRWRRRVRSRSFRIVLAELDSVLVGVASSQTSVGRMILAAFGPPALELRTLYVDAERRGRGVAQALLTETIGRRPAQLWVFEDNVRARRFYAKQGFRPDGRRKIDNDTGVPEIRMVRRRSGKDRAEKDRAEKD